MMATQSVHTPKARRPLPFANRVPTPRTVGKNAGSGTNLFRASMGPASTTPQRSTFTPFNPVVPENTPKKKFDAPATPQPRATAKAPSRGLSNKAASQELFEMRIPSPSAELTGAVLAGKVPKGMEGAGTVYADQFLAHLCPRDFDEQQRRQFFCVLDLRRLKYAADEIFAKKDWKLNVMNFAREFEKSRGLIMLRYGLYEFKNVKPTDEVVRNWKRAHGLPVEEGEETPGVAVGTKRKAEKQISKESGLDSKRSAHQDDEADVPVKKADLSKREILKARGMTSPEPAPPKTPGAASKTPTAAPPSATKSLFERLAKKAEEESSTPKDKPPSSLFSGSPVKGKRTFAPVESDGEDEEEETSDKENGKENEKQDKPAEKPADKSIKTTTWQADSPIKFGQKSGTAPVINPFAQSATAPAPKVTSALFGAGAAPSSATGATTTKATSNPFGAPSATSSTSSTPLFANAPVPETKNDDKEDDKDNDSDKEDGSDDDKSDSPPSIFAKAAFPVPDKPLFGGTAPSSLLGQTPTTQTSLFSTLAVAPADKTTSTESSLFGNAKGSATAVGKAAAPLFASADAAKVPAGLFGKSTPPLSTAEPAKSTNLFGQSSAAAAPLFGSGTAPAAKPVEAPASTASPLFGSSAPSTKPLFGASEPEAPKTTPSLSVSTGLFSGKTDAASAKPAGASIFGNPPSAEAPQSATPLFGNTGAAKAATPIFGAGQTPTSEAPKSAGGLFGTSSGISFGKPAESTPTETSKFQFGSSATPTATSSTFNFGSTATAPAPAPAPVNFGASTSSGNALFGSAPSFAPSTTSTLGTSFGSGAPAPEKPFFGNPASGVTTPSFTFGSAAPTAGVFGGSQAGSGAATPTATSGFFGNKATGNTPPKQTPAFNFGNTAAPQGSPMKEDAPSPVKRPFGGDSMNEDPPAKKLFGANAPAVPAFSFGSSTTPSFGAPLTGAATPGFGNSTTPSAFGNTGSAGSGFQFKAPAPAPPAFPASSVGTPAVPVSFGSATTPTSFNFGGTPAGNAPGGGFSFTSGGASAASSGASTPNDAGNNMFSFSSTGTSSAPKGPHGKRPTLVPRSLKNRGNSPAPFGK